MQRTSYLVAIGSNRRHIRYGGPAGVLRASMKAMADSGLEIQRMSAIHLTPAMGPGGRNFANAVAVVRCDLSPPALLDRLKKIERSFGRRLARRWGARVLDLDIVLRSEE